MPLMFSGYHLIVMDTITFNHHAATMHRCLLSKGGYCGLCVAVAHRIIWIHDFQLSSILKSFITSLQYCHFLA